MFRKFALAVAVAASAVTSVGCAAVVRELPMPAAKAPASVSVKPPCAPGEVIVSVDEETPCDLIGGVNTLTITDISREDAEWGGCTFDGDDAGVNCDF